MVSIAIIGRPNVGKSTLFNRLVGKRLALVDDRPGVTRDRREGEAQLLDIEFQVLDTAGLEEAGGDTLEGRMRAQTEAAIAAADLSLFVVDAKSGMTRRIPILESCCAAPADRSCWWQTRPRHAARMWALRCILAQPWRACRHFGRAWRGHGRPS